MLLNNVFRNAFHAEDFNIKPGPVGESIVDRSQVFLMDLAHVHAQPCELVSPAASEGR